MSARWMLAALAGVFAVLAAYRLVRSKGRWDPAAKAWTIIAVIFAILGLFVLR